VLEFIRRSLFALSVRTFFLVLFVSSLIPLLLPSPALAAPQTATRDAQAVTLIQSSLTALTGSAAVNDATLQSTASYVAGSDQESGSALMVGRLTQESIVQLNLSRGIRQQMRNGAAGVWSGPDGVVHSMATANCRTDASWFFPAITLESIAGDSTLALSYLGADTSKGASLLHVRVARVVSVDTPIASAEILRESTMDIYFDPQSLLPMVLDFDIHPDNDNNPNIPVEILFPAYQNLSGALAPYHIQKLIQGTLTLDLTVTSVIVNSGVPDSEFVLPSPATSTGGAQ
jgi:hypothetical protein